MVKCCEENGQSGKMEQLPNCTEPTVAGVLLQLWYKLSRKHQLLKQASQNSPYL